jgi:eukaryotic-like serine/threonine-protein kinase
VTISIAPGTLIDNRYRVVSRVGSGGMAEVYCADDVQLGRRVAVKLLHERFAADDEFVERFRREASSAAALSHANIVSVYDRGEWSGTYYIVMEYLDGRSLDSIVREEAPLPADRAIELTEQVLRAARFAHRRGIVHRDLKPHNVIIDEEGRIKVTDFGIARAGAGASEITQTGSIMGTARYLSPEQAQGNPVSPRSDLYSIGVMLYELLTGTVPFEGDSVVAIALRHLSEPPRPPSSLVPSISPALDAIVLRALAKSPDERFADADEFIAALENERARIRGDSGAHTAALAPLVVNPPALYPTPPGAYPGTYATQAIGPITGTHGRAAAAWWDPAGSGTIPPGTAMLPPGGRDRGPVWPWVLIGVLVAIGAAVAIILLLDKGAHRTPTPLPTVPGVVGLRKVGADARIGNAGYVPLHELINSHRKVGTVVRQKPGAGTQLSRGSTVLLDISSGPKVTTVQIPSVAGERLLSAIHDLHVAGFRVSPHRQASTTVPKSTVISVSPGPGTPLVKGSTVVIVYSSGPPKVAVPDVVNETVDAARPVLQARGFTVAVKQHATGGSPPGTVLSQVPSAGKAPQGSTVTLTVAKALPNAVVPDLFGLSVKAANASLTGVGLASNPIPVIRHVDPGADGKVISQLPLANTSVKPGSEVTFKIEHFVRRPTGPTGPSGGTSGPSGPNGGTSGPSGPSGGVSGPSGPSGGVSGPTGVSGISGVSGVSGVTGLTGITGVSGLAGITGAT